MFVYAARVSGVRETAEKYEQTALHAPVSLHYIWIVTTHILTHTYPQTKQICTRNDSLQFGTSVPPPGWWAGVAFP